MSRRLLIVALGASSWVEPVLAQTCPDRESWPTEAWTTRATPADPEAVRALEAYAFTLTGSDEERLGLRTDGLVVVHEGEIVYERYARGWDADGKHRTWSVAKSITSALTGIAVGEGLVSLDDSVCDHVEVENPEVCDVKVRNVLDFSTGLDWSETYENGDYQASSPMAMLYGEGHADVLGFVTSHALRDEPGTQHAYSSGDATLLAAVLRAAFEPTRGAHYAWTSLFDRVGMSSMVVEGDVLGTPLGGTNMYATPRDLAKFGFLYLNDGCWEGERILPEGWVERSTTMSDVFRQTGQLDIPETGGWMWWLNQPIPERGKTERPWPEAPEDAYAAMGWWGQFVIVVPSEDLVIVRTGDDRNDNVDLGKLISLSIEVSR